jgi:hypothetical protein
MATRSTIAVQHEDGKISQIYCHWDGYLSHNGRILQHHYNTLAQAEELVSHGSLSILAERINPIGDHSFDNPESGTCVYYGRDRGELHTEPSVFWDLEHYMVSNDGEEYDYLFVNGRWQENSQKHVVWLDEELED